jgi:hypothetical protein
VTLPAGLSPISRSRYSLTSGHGKMAPPEVDDSDT